MMKLTIIYTILYLCIFITLCCASPSYSVDVLVTLELSFYVVAIIALLHFIAFVIYSMTPWGKKAIEEDLEKDLGGLPFVYLMGLEQFEADTIVKIVIVDGKFIIKNSDLSKVKEFNLNDIKSIKPLSDDTITEKEKSVIGRAVVGGLIFGVVGAIVGGMSGIGTKREIKTEYFIKVTFNDNNELLLAPFMNNPENYKYLTRKLDEYKGKI